MALPSQGYRHTVERSVRILVGDDRRLVVPDWLLGEGAVHFPAARRDYRAGRDAP